MSGVKNDGNTTTCFENIAVTNIVKCNISIEGYRDTTPRSIREKCLESKIFEKEIMALNPKHVIFLTGPNKTYDEAITAFINHHKGTKGRKTKRDYGKIVWWECTLYNGKKKCFVLRTSHPQGKHKDIFVNGIVKWIARKKH